MRSFIYCPRSGDRVFAENILPGTKLGVVEWSNACRHITGGVEVSFNAAIAGKWWRDAARDLTAHVVNEFGGVTWDDRGDIHAHLPPQGIHHLNQYLITVKKTRAARVIRKQVWHQRPNAVQLNTGAGFNNRLEFELQSFGEMKVECPQYADESVYPRDAKGSLTLNEGKIRKTKLYLETTGPLVRAVKDEIAIGAVDMIGPERLNEVWSQLQTWSPREAAEKISSEMEENRYPTNKSLEELFDLESDRREESAHEAAREAAEFHVADEDQEGPEVQRISDAD